MTDRLRVPALGSKCEDCSVFKFNQCSAMFGMKALAGLVVIANDNEHPQAPWARRSLGILGLGVGDSTPRQDSDVSIVANAVQQCDGPAEKKYPEASIPKSRNHFVYPGSDIRRRPIAKRDKPNAEPTVKIQVDHPGRISEFDKAKGSSVFVRFGDYVEALPAMIVPVSPFGSPGEVKAPDNNTQNVLDAVRRIKDTEGATLGSIMSPSELMNHVSRLREAANSGEYGHYTNSEAILARAAQLEKRALDMQS